MDDDLHFTLRKKGHSFFFNSLEFCQKKESAFSSDLRVFWAPMLFPIAGVLNKRCPNSACMFPCPFFSKGKVFESKGFWSGISMLFLFLLLLLWGVSLLCASLDLPSFSLSPFISVLPYCFSSYKQECVDKIHRRFFDQRFLLVCLLWILTVRANLN